MVVGDAYATLAEYKAAVDKTKTGDDAEIGGQLIAVSRLIDRRTGRFFSVDAAPVARLYDGRKAVRDGTRIYVADVSTLTGLIVKVDLDDDFDFSEPEETLTINDHFWMADANAALGPEPRPWTALDIKPTNGRLDVWPAGPRKLEVTAAHGWPAVPAAIREATISITREWRDLQEAGMTLELEAVDQVVNLSSKAFSIVTRTQAEYSRRVPFA